MALGILGFALNVCPKVIKYRVGDALRCTNLPEKHVDVNVDDFRYKAGYPLGY